MRPIAALLLALTLACEPPPNDEAAPGDGGVATIQRAATCGGWMQPPCQTPIPGNVRVIEDLNLYHGMNDEVFAAVNAGPPARLTSQYGLYPNPTVGAKVEFYYNGQWWPLGTGAIIVAQNYGGDFVQVSNQRLCALAWGCSPIVVNQTATTFYRLDITVPRNSRLIRRIWYRRCAFGGPWIQVLTVGPAVDVTTAPDGIFSTVNAQGVYANMPGWAAAACPSEYGAYTQDTYLRCDPGQHHQNERCIAWPPQGSCDARSNCPPF